MNKKKELEEFFLNNNIRTYIIEYYPKIFGNLVVKFQYNGVEHCLITDRDEIVLDGETVYLANYHDYGIQTIELVKKEINKIISK
jgi:hypothetical protein